MILLIAQAAITVTGAIVRVTGSGLGCETWPNCQPGTLFPKAGVRPWIHQIIEFGNRTLTIVLVAIAVAVVWAMYKAQRRQELKILAWVGIAGIIAQAVIGGISVHLDLQWWAVALHFLPSEILVWAAAILYTRIAQPDDGVKVRKFSPVIQALAITGAVTLCISLMTGTMTTGTGPHAGDEVAGQSGRLAIETSTMAHIHSYFVYLFIAVVAAIIILSYRAKGAAIARRNAWILVVLLVVQAIIGLSQYHFGVPAWMVPIHVGVSSAVTAFTAFLYALGVKREGGKAVITGSPDSEKLLARN